MEQTFKEFAFWNHSLPLEERIQDLISHLTIEEKISLIPTRQAAVDRLGVPAYCVGGEAAHGVAWKGEATVFPQPIGLACTWNPELMKQIGSAVGDEARVFYQNDPTHHGLTLWAPTVDMERDPRWGRTEEAYGEDPHLTGKLTSSLIQGMQGDHPFYLKMVATLKHFFANNNEVDRLTFSSSIDPRNMHEYYLKAFEMPFVEGGAYSMMTAYNSINGTPAIESPYVNQFVKGEWKMPGFIVCDGGDLSQTVEYHKYHKTHAESVAGALKAGVDCLTDEQDLVIDATREALDRGLIDEQDLNHAIRNIFHVRFKLGQFDPSENNPYAAIPSSALMSPEHSKLSHKAAQESIVLLRNEGGLLPLSLKNTESVAVIGPLGDIVYTDWYSGTLPYSVTPFAGISKKLEGSGRHVSYHSGDDVIKLKTVGSGWYVVAGKETTAPLMPQPDGGNDKRALFKHTDWGYGSHTLQSIANGLYVTANDELTLHASAERVWGWFVKEVMDISSQDDEYVSMKTWNGHPIRLSTDEYGATVLRGSEDKESLHDTNFTKEVVSDGLAEAIKAARENEVAVVFVGNSPFVNGKEEVDRPGIELPPAQVELIKEVCKVNPRTVVVIVGSYPYALGEIAEIAPAIIYSSHGGQELGNAIADVLFGDYSPAGRLNMTWYQNEAQLTDFLDYDIIKTNRTYMYFDGKPLYPFGYGLTYSEFNYNNMIVAKSSYHDSETIQLEMEVTNTGDMVSDEVVQLYVKALQSRVKTPIKQLKAFRRINLEPGQKKKVSFQILVSELAIWDVTRDRFCVESGGYQLLVGSSSEDIRLDTTVQVTGEAIPHRDLTGMTYAENYDDYQDVILDECLEGRTGVRAVNDQGWVVYHDVEFKKTVDSLEMRVSGGIAGGKVELRLGSPEGTQVGHCTILPSHRGEWSTVTCDVEEGLEGIHSIYLVLQGSVSISHFTLSS
ncbi:glycoside hydrolase family 3 C-terminal domain-containing protein [Paenibacillus crassostreae]|uniref:Beta-glucosidase n=1 Tax=Paenibacillus crassostreae TaxID=1763538 RepID=A0A167FSG2_9BACL|nr:glycoside hydrolase family 3 C-terminal domain-containing protein [Paenibacillus crassostreae]AOZ94108.1 beta-glucosidase [Paenibacillus crassostreae]OAB76856.1 beta-glucosidase [Paenibacillus crassostreae]